MANLAFSKSFRPAQLHDEVAAALGGAAFKFKHIAATSELVNGIGTTGNVVHDGTLSAGEITAVNNAIAAHTPTQTSKEKLVAQAAQAIADLDTAIAALASDLPATWNNTARDIVEALCRNQKKVIQFLSDQMIS